MQRSKQQPIRSSRRRGRAATAALQALALGGFALEAPQGGPRMRLKRDDFSPNRHPALAYCWSMIFFRKPVSTFRDHALAYCWSMIFFRKPVSTFRDHALAAKGPSAFPQQIV
jgi:hypothetical protein